MLILDAVQTALPSATCHFELTALSTGLRACLAVVVTWSLSEVLARLTLCAITFEKKAFVTSGTLQCRLIKSENLSTRSQNASTSRLAELQGTNCHLWNNKQALIIHDLANNNSNCIGILLLQRQCKSRHRIWAPVRVRKAEPMRNLLVEIVARTPCNEGIKVVEHLHVNILRGRRTTALPCDAVLKVNTHCKRHHPAMS